MLPPDGELRRGGREAAAWGQPSVSGRLPVAELSADWGEDMIDQAGERREPGLRRRRRVLGRIPQAAYRVIFTS